MLGGGMRQVGILAAAGLIALQKMTRRLGEDHTRARNLAEGLSENHAIILDGAPQTNMVFFNLAPHVKLSNNEITARLKDHGILVSDSGPRRFRLVTHYWIDDSAIEKTVATFHAVLQ
jgi:threonine aldolase